MDFKTNLKLFAQGLPFKRIYVKKGETDGHIKVEESGLVQPMVRKACSPSDISEYERAKSGNIAKKIKAQEKKVATDSLSELERASIARDIDMDEQKDQRLKEIYKTYFEDKPLPKCKLIISQYKEKILTMIEENKVIILAGPTGCGKTTKVPQFILDSHIENRRYCNIIISQPRRIAAISVAKRISEERNWPLGSVVGYKVGLKNCTSQETHITYATIGVLLQKLIKRSTMNQYTHIILDEIHEREQCMDFVMLVLKRYLMEDNCNLKVILMSATVKAEKFAEYFRSGPDPSDFAPILTIESSTNYPVQKYYLEELSEFGELPDVRREEPEISETAYDLCISLLKHFEEIDPRSGKKGAVLIFLPGLYEIEYLYSKLKCPAVYNSGGMEYKWSPLPLHSSITAEEQIQVFKAPPSGYRKIILSTNLAESSITVSGVKFVIDFCLTKNLSTDKNSNFTSLQLAWASKANCVQRAGRVGRVMEGRVYRMVYKEFYEDLKDEAVPEMLTSPLEKVVLQAKVLNMGEPREVLASALDPPDLTDIEYTILVLKELGGLLRTCNGTWKRFDGDLTPLGHLMAVLPVDIHISRLIVLGHLFSCLEDCIIIGACMSLKSIFSHPFRARMKAYNAKLDWADGSLSDAIAFLNAYEVWMNNHKNGYFRRSAGDSEENWAKRHFIQLSAMNEVRILVDELTHRLRMNNIEIPMGRGRVHWSEYHRALILKIVIAGAFYPNYFGRGGLGGRLDEKYAVKTLGGRNPFTTVYLHGFPAEQPLDLYVQFIKDELAECEESMSITSDGSCKIFVEFRHNSIKTKQDSEIPCDGTLPGRIPMAVYRAIKLRHIRKSICINILPLPEARRRAIDQGVPVDGTLRGEGRKTIWPSPIFDPDITCLSIIISHVVDPGNFWAYETGDAEQQKFIFEYLNNDGRAWQRFRDKPRVGELCIAPFEDKGETSLYRARIEELFYQDLIFYAKVFYVDYGNYAIVKFRDLRSLPQKQYRMLWDIPALAFECVLTKIRPSLMLDPRGKWTDKARMAFDRVTHDVQLYGCIFSVVNGVVSLELFSINSNREQLSINDFLIREGFAQAAEENYLSKVNNEIRKKMRGGIEGEYEQPEAVGPSIPMIDPPKKKECKIPIEMSGPFSPLEMTIYPYTRGSTGKRAAVSADSVNSVLLDSDPQDPHEWFLVAAHINQSASSSILSLKNTTILPNIHGLAAIVSLLFSPVIEMRTNDDGTQYNGVLCGLGVDETGYPLLPEHDFELYFDSEITYEDFVAVNNMRYCMSMLLMADEGETVPSASCPDKIRYQKRIEKTLTRLLTKQRESREIEWRRRNQRWGLFKPDIVLEDKVAIEFDRKAIFRFHPGISLLPERPMPRSSRDE